MDIIPDDKNWTWVLERACPECGVDVEQIELAQAAQMVRGITDRWVAVLAGPDVSARTRPDRWSALEYGCHVRDVFKVFDGRLNRMLAEDGPRFENWDQDATAVDERYSEQGPSQVAAETAEAGERLARSYERVGDGDWARTGFRSDGAAFTIDTFTRYFLHDPLHHLWDVSA